MTEAEYISFLQGFIVVLFISATASFIAVTQAIMTWVKGRKEHGSKKVL